MFGHPILKETCWDILWVQLKEMGSLCTIEMSINQSDSSGPQFNSAYQGLKLFSPQ